MTAPVFDLTAARRDTAHWPPLDGDIWTDRDGREWLAGIVDLPGDNAIIGFSHDKTRCVPRYALEKYGPLTLKFGGHARQQYDQLPAEVRERETAYLAGRCPWCGPEGATGPECRDCLEGAEAAA
ncbi:hypothetical protein AB0B63_18590 [Micromonospora sp. NPDC049081]|uniref:hypothetical protein n=1 Tax=Micromonospora sp. NPDC049081 TaxID=3155150 RepID=UPI0033F4B1F9